MSIGKRKSNAPVGFNFNPNVGTQLNTSLLNMGNKQLTDAERKKLGMPDLSLTSGLLSSMAPKKEKVVPITTTPPVIPKALATDIPKFTKFGDRFASMGGLDKVLSQDDLAKMTQEEVDAYSKKRVTGRNRGTSDLLMALGTAFKGGDIVGSVQGLRDQRSEEDEADRVMQLNQEISKAYASGDYDLVNQLMLEKGDPSGTQAISNRINKERNTISADGKLIYTLDESGNIIDAQPNTDVIEAMQNNSLKTADANTILKSTKQARVVSTKMNEIDGFLKNIEDGELKFGTVEGIFDTIAESTGVGGDTEAINSREFNNFKNGLVTDLLALQSGTKTDFDWTSLNEQLKSVNSTDGVKDWLKRYKLKLTAEEQAIKDERDLYMDLRGVDNSLDTPTNFDDVVAGQ